MDKIYGNVALYSVVLYTNLRILTSSLVVVVVVVRRLETGVVLRSMEFHQYVVSAVRAHKILSVPELILVMCE